MIRSILVFCAAASLAITVAAVAPTQNPDVAMLCAVNKERAKAGLKPLGLDPNLTKAATQHSQYQASTRKMGHNGKGGSSPSQRIKASGFKAKASGENVAYGYKDVASVMKTWMNSPGHRKNILGSQYTMFGSGVAKAGSTPYYTQNFGSDGSPARNIPKCDGSDAYPSGGGGGRGGYPSGGDDYPSGGDDYGSNNNNNSYGGHGGNNNSYGGRGGNDNSYGGNDDYSSGGDDYPSGGSHGGRDGSHGGRGGSRDNDYGGDRMSGGDDRDYGGRGGSRGGKDKDCDENKKGGRGGSRY